MRKNGDVDYGEYNYKSYIWHEDGRENLPDRRARKSRAEKVEKGRKPRKGKKNGRVIKMDKEGAIVAITMLLCFLITFILAETLGGANLLGVFDKKESAAEVYYAVIAETLDDESLSAIAADELRQLGGAGYVIRDKSYLVVASVYSDKGEAETVISRLDSYSATVYELTIPEPKLKWCKTADKDLVTDTLNYASEAFTGLYEISVELDKSSISEAQAVSRIKILYNEIEKITSELDTITVKKDDFNLIRLKAEITAAMAMLGNLKNDALTRYNLVSDIRYTYTAILVGYKNLTGNI